MERSYADDRAFIELAAAVRNVLLFIRMPSRDQRASHAETSDSKSSPHGPGSTLVRETATLNGMSTPAFAGPAGSAGSLSENRLSREPTRSLPAGTIGEEKRGDAETSAAVSGPGGSGKTGFEIIAPDLTGAEGERSGAFSCGNEAHETEDDLRLKISIISALLKKLERSRRRLKKLRDE